MADTWDEVQAVKNKRNSLRERLEKRKKERQDIFGTSAGGSAGSTENSTEEKTLIKWESVEVDSESELSFLHLLLDKNLILPCNSKQLIDRTKLTKDGLHYLMQKYASQQVISMQDVSIDSESGFEIILIDAIKVAALFNELNSDAPPKVEESAKRKFEELEPETKVKLEKIDKKMSKEKSTNCPTSDIMSLLSLPSTKEKQSKQVGVEILELLSKPTAKERSLAEKFRSQGGAQVMEFCPYGTKFECEKMQLQEEMEERKAAEENGIKQEENGEKLLAEEFKSTCNKLHFKKIIQAHTDESLGDCSFLNTCFHMDSCKYVHYEVDAFMAGAVAANTEIAGGQPTPDPKVGGGVKKADNGAILYPPQWIQCDLRYLDMTVLGKFAVIMADPPWDIHMELPYGTMSDDEMRQLGVPALQDDGLIFLWVTGRAMELGRECLKLWGYERVDELIWVKTNQLQRIIRTGRTGHWLNHGKEHCLVGMKGNPTNLNRGLDCDVIVAEVRATSHKPDEIYGLIERLSPGTRKIELFGRQHNCNPNWITLGNQLDGIRLVDPELISSFQKRYPDGSSCMAPAKK